MVSEIQIADTLYATYPVNFHHLGFGRFSLDCEVGTKLLRSAEKTPRTADDRHEYITSNNRMAKDILTILQSEHIDEGCRCHLKSKF